MHYSPGVVKSLSPQFWNGHCLTASTNVRTVLTRLAGVHEASVYTRDVALFDGIRKMVREELFSPETVGKLQQMVWEEKRPVREITTPVYEFAS